MLGKCLAELLFSLHLFFELLLHLLSRLCELPLALLHLRFASNFTFGRNRNKQRNPKQTPNPGPRASGSGAARDAHGDISPDFPSRRFWSHFDPLYSALRMSISATPDRQ
jgi:hypothetical protein